MEGWMDANCSSNSIESSHLPWKGIEVEDELENFNLLSIREVFGELGDRVHDRIMETLLVGSDALRGFFNAGPQDLEMTQMWLHKLS